MAKSRHYVAVELNTPEECSRFLENSISEAEKDNKIGMRNFGEEAMHEYNGTPISIIQEDMLNFLKRLPDNSVSILCSGIDTIVIPDAKYREDVEKEIERVLDPSGAYIGENCGGHIETENLQRETIDGWGSFNIYTKKRVLAENKEQINQQKNIVESKEKKITSLEQLLEEEKKFLKRVDELEIEGLDGSKLDTPEFWCNLKKIADGHGGTWSEDSSQSQDSSLSYLVGDSKIHDAGSFFREVYLRFSAHYLESKNLMPKGSLDVLRKAVMNFNYFKFRATIPTLYESIDKTLEEEIEKISENNLKQIIENCKDKSLLGYEISNLSQLIEDIHLASRDDQDYPKEALDHLEISEETIQKYTEARLSKNLRYLLGHIFLREPYQLFQVFSYKLIRDGKYTSLEDKK